MPFKSKKQQRYAFATDQPWAKEFASETKKIKRGKKKGFKALPEQVEKNAFGVVHKKFGSSLTKVPLNSHQTAIKVAMKQARTGQMKVSDAQASANWAAKQAKRAGIQKSDISKSTREQRYKRRVATGATLGAGAGAGAGLGYGLGLVYGAQKADMQDDFKYAQDAYNDRRYLKHRLALDKWAANGLEGDPPSFPARDTSKWRNPGAKKILRAGLRQKGVKPVLGGLALAAAPLGVGLGGYAGTRYHQRRERIGPYSKKKR